MEVEYRKHKENVIVFAPEVARRLLGQGFRIVDIKPDANDPDRKKTLFVFRNDKYLYKTIRELTGTRSD